MGHSKRHYENYSEELEYYSSNTIKTMKLIKIRLRMNADKEVFATTENFEYGIITTVGSTIDECIDNTILMIRDELISNGIDDDFDLEFVYRVKLRK